jgi:hypothetical protein
MVWRRWSDFQRKDRTMAASKSVRLPGGVDAQCWSRRRFNADKTSDTLFFVLLGFVSDGVEWSWYQPMPGVGDLRFGQADIPGEGDIRCIPAPVLCAMIGARIAEATQAGPYDETARSEPAIHRAYGGGGR